MAVSVMEKPGVLYVGFLKFSKILYRYSLCILYLQLYSSLFRDKSYLATFIKSNIVIYM
jgi:hypothetical protein